MKRDNNKLFTISLGVIPVVFYLFFWLLDGAVWCADTASYVEMHQAREPLYPLYLAFLRFIFGDVARAPFHNDQLLYLFMATLGQSLLAAVVTYKIGRYFSERFNLGLLASYAVLALPMATSLLCRFAAKRSSMYSNSILTEGIAISIYLLFIRFCTEYLLDRTRSSFIKCAVLCFVGISVRKQMNLLLALLVLASVYVIVSEKKERVRECVRGLLTVVVVLISVRLFDYTYNYFIFNKFMGHTEDNRFVTTMAFYVAEREDVQYVEPGLQELFLQIYDACDENDWLMHSAPDDWLGAVSHFGDNYDHIQIDTMEVMMQDDVKVTDYSWLGNDGDVKDLIRESLNRSLIPHRIPRLIKAFANNMLSGLVTTVAVRRPILCIYSVFAYVLYVGLLGSLIYKMICSKKKGLSISRYKNALIFGLLVLISILGNVALVSAVIFTQTRYTIYNMPLFYIAIVIMICSLLNNNCNNNVDNPVIGEN